MKIFFDKTLTRANTFCMGSVRVLLVHCLYTNEHVGILEGVGKLCLVNTSSITQSPPLITVVVKCISVVVLSVVLTATAGEFPPIWK